MPLYIAQSGDLDRCYRCLTDSQTLKDRATQLLTKYKGGALVTQYQLLHWSPLVIIYHRHGRNENIEQITLPIQVV